MSEAVLQSSFIDHQATDISQARQQRLAATLVYLMRDFKKQLSKIDQMEGRIDEVEDELTTILSKRKRLSSQNFSSSPHLKATHIKYWNKQQQLTQVKEDYTRKLYSYRRTSRKTARKISDLRARLLN